MRLGSATDATVRTPSLLRYRVAIAFTVVVGILAAGWIYRGEQIGGSGGPQEGAALAEGSSEPASSGLPRRRVTIAADYGGTGVVPAGWFHLKTAIGEHFGLAYVATTSRLALKDAVEGSHKGTRYRIRGLNEDALTPQDAFVEVEVYYMAHASPPDLPPVPYRFRPAHLRCGRGRFGGRVCGFGGIGSDSGIYNLRYWIGPAASDRTRSQTMMAIRKLRLGAGTH